MEKEENFHSRKLDEIFSDLRSNPNGLEDKDAELRLKNQGRNILPEKKKSSQVFAFIKQFHSFLIYILIVAAIISYFFGHIIDVYVISIVVLINASIGFVQEYRAEKSISALKKLIVNYAKVYRSGELIKVNSADLVPGDVILLEEGDRIPADARIIETRDLRAVESSLTGESAPVEKSENVLPEKTNLADRTNIVFLGTFISSGTAKALVVLTGSKTALGQIAVSIEEIKPERNHFKQKTDTLALQMAIIAFIGAAIVFLIGFFFRGFLFSEIFLLTIASLVSGIPEGLPAVLAIVLAIGAYRMSRKNSIIRTLPATETLGVVDTIITDKTGTLTKNTMTSRIVFLLCQNEIKVSGFAWNPQGEFFQNGEKINPQSNQHLIKILNISALCTKATLVKENSEYNIIGEPTEASLVVLAEKAGLKKSSLLKQVRIIDEMPFSSQQKYRASLVSCKGRNEIYSIGAPEVMLKKSQYILKNGRKTRLIPQDRSIISRKIESLTEKGMRVIGLAYKESTKSKISDSEIKGLTFAGLVAMIDPPRPEVKDAIEKAKKAGIRVIMVTGDHKGTAVSVAKEIGLIEDESALTEQDLLALSEKEFVSAVLKTSVFARLTPQMKLRICSTLQRQGHIVAMTGDGVNDAPSLKKANVGISMGIMGTDVARESSEMVLADDNFASIISAIEEGRIVFSNSRRTSFFLVTTNFAEHATIISSLLLGMPLPLLPTQILWLNFVTDTGSGLGLASEPGHKETLNRKPLNSKENILTKEIIPFFIFMTIIMASITVFTFSRLLPFGIEVARTGAFAAMTITQWFNAYNLRSLRRSLFKIRPFSNKYLNIAILASIFLFLCVIYLPFLQSIFRFSYLPVKSLLLIALFSSSVLISGEIYKLIRYRLIHQNISESKS